MIQRYFGKKLQKDQEKVKVYDNLNLEGNTYDELVRTLDLNVETQKILLTVPEDISPKKIDEYETQIKE